MSVEEDQRTLHGQAERLIAWVIRDAAPLWAMAGVDALGSFAEQLGLDGEPLPFPRRARVPPRQFYAFAKAATLGWAGPAVEILRRGLPVYLSSYRRPDGFYRTLVDAEGQPLDDSVLLYDQAFALLGFASALPVVGEAAWREAVALRGLLLAHMHTPGLGFRTALAATDRSLSNPHMHLLEACLAWMSLDPDPVWRAMADEIVELALTRFVDPETGAVREVFENDWSGHDSDDGRSIEPGHQFEWGWLLLVWIEACADTELVAASAVKTAAYRMIDVGLTHGIDRRRNVARDALFTDLGIRSDTARLWPQTEWLKAAIRAAAQSGDARYLAEAVSAADAVLLYLDTPITGLWADRMSPLGVIADEPSPASSFYHLVCAIAELKEQLPRHTDRHG